MSKKIRRALFLATAVTLIISLLLCFTGCVFEEIGKKISDAIVDKQEQEITNAHEDQNSGKNTISEDILYEDIIVEDRIKEEILKEEKVSEIILSEILRCEDILVEDAFIEDVHIEVLTTEQDLDDEFSCESYLTYTFDFTEIRKKLAQGISIVITEVVIDAGALLVDIVTANYVEAIIDAAQIYVTTSATTLAGFIAAQVAKAKSMAAGNSADMVLYDSLEAGVDAFYQTAVYCDVVNTIVSMAQMVVSGVKAAKEIASIVKTAKEIAKITGEFTLKSLDEVTYTVTVGERTIKCKMASGTTDLYDVTTKEYVGSLVKSGDEIKSVIKEVPDQVFDAKGNLKYICEGNNISRIHLNKNTGEMKKTLLGTVDPGGFVKNSAGQIVDHIDLATGAACDGFRGMARTGKNISYDVFGNIIDLNTGKELAIKRVNGVNTYIDSQGKQICTQYTGKNGITYVKNINGVDNGKVIGSLTEEGTLDFTWKLTLDKVRLEATKKFRSGLVEFVQNRSLTEVRSAFPELTLEQIDYIKSYNKIPTSVEIHHCKNVANYPDYAGDLSNLEALSHDNHLKAHAMNYRNSTSGQSANYTNVTQYPEFR